MRLVASNIDGQLSLLSQQGITVIQHVLSPPFSCIFLAAASADANAATAPAHATAGVATVLPAAVTATAASALSASARVTALAKVTAMYGATTLPTTACVPAACNNDRIPFLLHLSSIFLGDIMVPNIE